MDKKSVKEYITLLEESNLSSLKVKTDKGELHLQKEVLKEFVEPTRTLNREAQEEIRQIEPKNMVKAPMVGTFFSALSAKEKPYVSIGQEVQVGNTLCILEAMKVMNEIKSDVSGVVKEILVENAMSVEFGQPLFVIE